MLLSLCQISHFFGSRLVFKDVSLDVAPGTVTLLAGANGAGKSTLLKIMAGLVRPSSGKIQYGAREDGGEISTGFLGHQTFLYPELTARENLVFWSTLHGKSLNDALLADILDRVELGAFAEEKAKSFSRGMAQRLNLARVFLLRADVLLLDEPATGLDTRSTGILHREIASAKAAGSGIVWITHSLEADLCYADKAAVLGGKKLAFYGSADECRRMLEADKTTPLPFETPVQASGGELC